MRKPIYFNRKPVADRHTNTTSDKDPTSTRRACTIISLMLRRLAINIVQSSGMAYSYSATKGTTDWCLLGWAWAWLHCTCVSMFACLLAWTNYCTVNFKWAYSNVSQRYIVKHMKASGGFLSECSVGDPEQRQLKLKHAWHWFVLLPITASCSQAVQVYYDIECGWLVRFRWWAMHKRHS